MMGLQAFLRYFKSLREKLMGQLEYKESSPLLSLLSLPSSTLSSAASCRRSLPSLKLSRPLANLGEMTCSKGGSWSPVKCSLKLNCGRAPESCQSLKCLYQYTRYWKYSKNIAAESSTFNKFLLL
ncbi:hypothetical protein ACOSP7_025148 [Xanthoceras sorbifolium]